MNIVLLDRKLHDRSQFDCNIKALNNYLKLMANQQSAKDHSRTYVLEDEEDRNIILGFYTLTMAKLDKSLLPENLQKKH